MRGRQCSDFLAFNRHKLEAGVERGLDAQVTRTLMGAAYPVVGLHSKYFDLDMDPLCQIVQDTVGRHDTFALACTRKYYEDMGYFGHLNCTENFNAQLDPFGIAPRKGWPAMNFFYNTGFDSDLMLVSDEPWSRPGDYVLLRALDDLVCASSACPDDIDPANGWDVTDIHVRVYAPENRFSMAIAHRMTPDAEPVMTKETAFHPRWSALTRNVTEYRGYWLPTCFTNEGAIAEYWACREAAVVMDLSPLRKCEILGPDAETLVQHAITRDVRRLAIGQVVYTAVCNETGGMLDDAHRLPARRRQVPLRRRRRVRRRAPQAARRAASSLRVWIKPSTDELHNIAVQGPKSREILKEFVWTPPHQPQLEELEWFRFIVGRIGDYDGIPIVVSRTGYTGELGYEVFCHPDDGPAVWDAVWQAGEPRGIKPLGLDALDMVRIESGLIFAGYEFDDQVDPFEAGIGFAVKLDQDEDFIGKEALLERSAHPQRTLVGLELAGNEPAGHGDCVHVGRSQVGVVTSGDEQPAAAQEHRAVPDGRAVRRARHGGRGRQARRPPEADPGAGRAGSRSTTPRRSARARRLTSVLRRRASCSDAGASRRPARRAADARRGHRRAAGRGRDVAARGRLRRRLRRLGVGHERVGDRRRRPGRRARRRPPRAPRDPAPRAVRARRRRLRRVHRHAQRQGRELLPARPARQHRLRGRLRDLDRRAPAARRRDRQPARRRGLELARRPAAHARVRARKLDVGGLFALRLVVQLPLYLAGAVVALGVARTAMGLPLFALGVWLTWRLVRRTPPQPAPAPT